MWEDSQKLNLEVAYIIFAHIFLARSYVTDIHSFKRNVFKLWTQTWVVSSLALGVLAGIYVMAQGDFSQEQDQTYSKNYKLAINKNNLALIKL